MSNSLGKLAKSKRCRSYATEFAEHSLNFLTSRLLSPHHLLSSLYTLPKASGTFKFMSKVCELLIEVVGPLPKPQFKMITRFITEVSTSFNPFLPRAKTARLFLSFLPPNARQTMKIDTKLLPRASRDPSFIQLKFSKLQSRGTSRSFLTAVAEDGKQMKLDAEKLGIKGVVEEVDRHSRILSREEELNGS